MNKFLPEPESTAVFYPIPRKYPHPLVKKLAKLEKAYNKALEGKCFLDQARILKCGASTERKIERLKEAKA